MQPRSPHVGIVILNWKRPEDTLACIESLFRMDYPSFEVVIVDNSGDSVWTERVPQSSPNVTLITNSQNLGFAGGCNVGIAHLLRKNTDYVLLLNDDTEVAPNLLEVLVEAAEQDSSIGMLGPKILYYEPSSTIWSAGGAVDRYGQPTHLRADEPDADSAEQPHDVDYASGCALLVKRAVIDRIGPLDERFFAYFEETEWCARARRAGFRVVYVPMGRVWHKVTPTARGQSAMYLYLMTRNRLLYLRCSGARGWVLFRASLDVLRTATSWMLRPRHREKRALCGALLRGIGDFAIGRFGAPPQRLSP
jgi:GT2 family glycosyltransferase